VGGMSNTFVLAGEVIEVGSELYQQRPGYSTKKKLIVNDELFGAGSKALAKMKGDDDYSAERAARAYGRARRAKRAFSIALTLAAVDGPLPFGDAAAVVLLTGYGIYEIHGAILDFVQYD